MITKVVHGWRPAGLLAYLLGPGIAEVHRRPRVIASWDGLDAGWQPASTGQGEWDLELGPLVSALHEPVLAAGLPLRPPPGAGRGYVWHCSVRVAASDPRLLDGQWASIARELLHDAGIANRADAFGPRWVAVRHADDHIHIAAVLIRQDTGARIWPRSDYHRLRASARRIETRLGLAPTGAGERTAAPAPTRGELAKAERQQRVPARTALRAAVRRAALQADDLDGFVAALESAGVEVTLRRGPSGDVLGYAVAQRADLLAPGEPIFYSGSKLAPDLSLPRLRRRWEGTPPARSRRASGHRLLDTTRAALASGAVEADEVVAGVADVVTALASTAEAEDRRRWRQVGDLVHRSAPPSTRPTPLSGRLRGLARSLLRHRGFTTRNEVGSAAFMVALAQLLAELAAVQRRTSRSGQRARSTASAASLVATMSPPRRAGRSLVAHGAARVGTRQD